MLQRVQLHKNYLSRLPHQVSGGELARLNLCRAMLRPGSILLLDEPFSSLDEGLRHEMNALVRELHASLNLTTLCVTHHQEDAMLFADRILMLMEGEVVMDATPQQFAERPKSPQVASFMQIGSVVQIPSDSSVYYVRAGEFSPRNMDAANDHWRRISIANYRSAITGACRSIIDLESGKKYRVNQDFDFSGELWFDRTKVYSFERQSF